MTYELLYHPSVEKDLKSLSRLDRNKILSTIHSRLQTNPEHFGKALVGDLKGFYRLRVSFYRVIYRIEKSQVVVHVLQVGLRKNLKVYTEAAKRLKLL